MPLIEVEFLGAEVVYEISLPRKKVIHSIEPSTGKAPLKYFCDKYLYLKNSAEFKIIWTHTSS
ncbi:MAG: hypothetical protein ABIL77_01640 [candidate division WOR-3 bacterium]